MYYKKIFYYQKLNITKKIFYYQNHILQKIIYYQQSNITKNNLLSAIKYYKK
jgi:hypothetical protein